MVELAKIDAEITMMPQDGSVKTPVTDIQNEYGTDNENEEGDVPPQPTDSASDLPGVGEDGSDDSSDGGPGALDPFAGGGFGDPTGKGAMTPDGGPPVTFDQSNINQGNIMQNQLQNQNQSSPQTQQQKSKLGNLNNQLSNMGSLVGKGKPGGGP